MKIYCYFYNQINVYSFKHLNYFYEKVKINILYNTIIKIILNNLLDNFYLTCRLIKKII